MRYWLNILAIVAALYDGKILVWDISYADVRQGTGFWTPVILSLVVSIAFAAYPAAIGLRLAQQERTGAAIAVALSSLLMSAAGFVILQAAFTP